MKERMSVGWNEGRNERGAEGRNREREEGKDARAKEKKWWCEGINEGKNEGR